MNDLVRYRRSRIAQSRVVLERGYFDDASGSATLRVVCDTHGDTKLVTKRVPNGLGERVSSSREGRRMLANPWEWCVGCKAAATKRVGFEDTRPQFVPCPNRPKGASHDGCKLCRSSGRAQIEKVFGWLEARAADRAREQRALTTKGEH